MKYFNFTCIVLILIYCLISNYNRRNEIEYTNNRLNQAFQLIEWLEQDNIEFNNKHANHYAFEEDIIVKYLEKDKAVKYKAYLDSIKQNQKSKILSEYELR